MKFCVLIKRRRRKRFVLELTLALILGGAALEAHPLISYTFVLFIILPHLSYWFRGGSILVSVFIASGYYWNLCSNQISFYPEDMHAEGPKYVAIAGEQSHEVNIQLLIVLFIHLYNFWCLSLIFMWIISEGWNLGSQYCRKVCTATSKLCWWLPKCFCQWERSVSELNLCLLNYWYYLDNIMLHKVIF